MGCTVTLAGFLLAGCIGEVGGARTASGGGGAGGSAPLPAEPTPARACGTPSAGPSRLRQLTQVEYDNTVRELLGDTSNPARAFPPDTKVGSFDANAASVVTAPAAEKYGEAARAVATGVAGRLASILPCDPAAPGDETLCARKLVETLGPRMFRRPLTPAETDRWVGVFKTGRTVAALDFGGAVRLLVQGLLQSPHFLYHVELGEPAAGELRPLSAHELAARLSYYLWQGPPDEELFRAASEGRLRTTAQIEAQARRLFASPRARSAMRSFFEQWLEYGYMMNVEKNADRYPTFNAQLAKLMREETERFVDFVMGEGGGQVQTLLHAPFTFIPKELARHYGVAFPATSASVARVELDPRERGGVLTHASFLTAHASAASISPVLLGRFVREALLCQHVPEPPPGVDTNVPDVDPSLSARERLKPHTALPECASCHLLMDPIGFGFSRYDAIGRYRAVTETGRPIDASGELVATRDADGAFDGAPALAERLARSGEVHECFARQWLRFALGRLETELDDCSIRAAWDAFRTSGYDLRELVIAVVRTDAFRHLRRGCAQGAP